MPVRTRTSLLIALAVLLVLDYTRGQGGIVTIDDADSRVQFREYWIPNPGVPDTPINNFGGTLMFSNVSGSTATLSFTGSRVAVYGAYNVGTFEMKSQYSIDGGEPTIYSPPSTNTHWQHRRQFFRSDYISYGEHTLMITNLGDQFWLDFVQIEVPVGSQGTQGVQTFLEPQSQATQNEPMNTGKGQPMGAPAIQPSKTDGTSKQTSSRETDAQGDSTPDASPALTPRVPPDSELIPLQALQSTDASGGPDTPTSSLDWPLGSPVMAPSAIIGVTVAAVVLFSTVGLAAWWWRRRRRAENVRELVLFDPQSTVMSNSTDRQDGTRSAPRWSYHSSRPASDSTLQIHSRVSDNVEMPAHRKSLKNPVGEGVEMVRRDKRTSRDDDSPHTFMPIRPAIPRASEDVWTNTPPSVAQSHPGPDGLRALSPRPMRRRSVDGGVRIAGGRPGRDESCIEVEERTVAYTLPPVYQMYPSHN